MKESSLIRSILFNILLVLTLLVIYLLFFPKKSYVKEKLEETDPKVEETFNANINTIKIASFNYFKNNDKNKVTLQELIDNNLLTEIKDSNNELCDAESYAEKKETSLSINLKCNDKKDTRKIELGVDINGENCIYEYIKETKQYSDWSEWSDWQKEKIEKDDLTNVEEKIEKEEDGKEIVTRTNDYSIEATYNETVGCPAGYTENSGSCRSMVQGETISATPSYKCPTGYEYNGKKCVGSINEIDPVIRYSCPDNAGNVIFELAGDRCKTYYVEYIPKQTNSYYTCPNGYSLSGSRCYLYETYEEEITKYKEVTYYRYQKRQQKESKIETIWSTKDNQKLIDDSYSISRTITCEG